MTSPYLDRPLLPLAVALPRMLEKVAVKLPRQPRNGFDLCWRSRREALRYRAITICAKQIAGNPIFGLPFDGLAPLLTLSPNAHRRNP